MKTKLTGILKISLIVIIFFSLGTTNETKAEAVNKAIVTDSNWSTGLEVGSTRTIKFLHNSMPNTLPGTLVGQKVNDTITSITESHITFSRTMEGSAFYEGSTTLTRDSYKLFPTSGWDYPLTTTNLTFLQEKLDISHPGYNFTTTDTNFTIQAFQSHSVASFDSYFNVTYDRETGWLLNLELDNINQDGSLYGRVVHNTVYIGNVSTWMTGLDVGSFRTIEFLHNSMPSTLPGTLVGQKVNDTITSITDGQITFSRTLEGGAVYSGSTTLIKDSYKIFPTTSGWDYPLTTINLFFLREKLDSSHPGYNLTTTDTNFTIQAFKSHSMVSWDSYFNATYDRETGWLMKLELDNINPDGSLFGRVVHHTVYTGFTTTGYDTTTSVSDTTISESDTTTSKGVDFISLEILFLVIGSLFVIGKQRK
ncbi:MAG: hypothetical protein ACXAC7_02050 [Candidatus Hodarchaeales archaeon]